MTCDDCSSAIIRVQATENAQLYRCFSCGLLKVQHEKNATSNERAKREKQIVRNYLCESDLNSDQPKRTEYDH
jgi:DNA-directed RNA polymerase subunit M/transcription elongation factor TFIIS